MAGPRTPDWCLRVPYGQLLALCWCESHLQAIPAAMVRDGQTWCCGAPDCRELAVAA